MGIGEKIKELRITKKISQYELAEGTTLNQSQISKIEAGLRKVTVDDLKEIADVLKVPAGEILN